MYKNSDLDLIYIFTSLRAVAEWYGGFFCRWLLIQRYCLENVTGAVNNLVLLAVWM